MDPQADHDLLIRIDENVKTLVGQVNTFPDTYVTRAEFTPVRQICYGATSTLLLAVLGAIIGLVIKRGSKTMKYCTFILLLLTCALLVVSCTQSGDSVFSNSCYVSINGYRYGAEVEVSSTATYTTFTPIPQTTRVLGLIKVLDSGELGDVQIPEVPDLPEGADMSAGAFTVEGNFCPDWNSPVSTDTTTINTNAEATLGQSS